jgi:hypothetical protein
VNDYDCVARQIVQGDSGADRSLHCGRAPIPCRGFLGFAVKLHSSRAPVDNITQAWALGATHGFADVFPGSPDDSQHTLPASPGRPEVSQPFSDWFATHPNGLFFRNGLHYISAGKPGRRPAPTRLLGPIRGQAPALPAVIRCPLCGHRNRVELPDLTAH